MNVRFLAPARQELAEAADYYNSRREGLGDAFLREVETGVARIVRLPLAWPVIRGEIRKYLIRRFPYRILYAVEADDVVIVAVAHLRRDPEYWVDRLGDG